MLIIIIIIIIPIIILIVIIIIISIIIIPFSSSSYSYSSSSSYSHTSSSSDRCRLKDRSEALYHCITNIYIPTTTSSSQSSFSSDGANHNNDHPFSTSFIYKLALATISHENNTTTTTTTTTPSNNINYSSSTNNGSPLIVLYTSTIRSLFITLIQYYPSIYVSSVSPSSSPSSSSSPTFSSGINADYEDINSTDNNYNWLKKYISSLQHQEHHHHHHHQQQHNKVLKLHSCKIITELLAHDLIIYNNRYVASIDVNNATSNNTSLETSSSSVSDQQSYSINHLHSTVPISSSSSTTAVTEATTTISTDIDIDGRDNHVNNLSKISLICASSSVKYTISMLINMLQDGDHLMRAQAAVAVGNISKIIWKLLQMYPINCLLPHIKTLNTATIHETLSLDTEKNHIEMIQNSDNKNSLINIRLYVISLLLLNMKDKTGSVRASSYKSVGDCILNNILIINYSLHAAADNDDDHKDRNSNLSDYQLNSIRKPSIKAGDYQLISTILAQFLVGCHDSNLTVRIQAVWATGRYIDMIDK